VQIGDRAGVFYDRCNSAKAFAEAGGRVYYFELGHATSGSGQPFSLAEFKSWLRSATFDPASAK
jgi:hypothetical protein